MHLRFVLAVLGVLLVDGRIASAKEPLKPLSLEQRKIFFGSPEDVLNKPKCAPSPRRVTRKCRDIRHYVRTNEWHHQVFRSYIENAGGGYLGVGSDQGLTFIAWARCEMGWLIDYDPVVVRVNRIHRAFILNSEDIDTFVARWDFKNSKVAASKIITREYNGDTELNKLLFTYRYYSRTIGPYLNRMLAIGRKRVSHWLHDPSHYEYVRRLYKLDRIRVLKADLLKNNALRGVGTAAKRLGIPIRVVYLSNAEEFWRYTSNFRTNLTSLPMDQQSVVLRTRHSGIYGPKIGSYVYVVQNGLDFQRRLRSPKQNGIWVMMKDRQPVSPGLFTIGFPVTK